MKKFLLCGMFLLMSLFVYEQSNAQDYKIGGYMQTWLTLDQQTSKVAGSPGIEESTSGFRIRRARLSFKTDINETFGVTTWFEFAGVSKNLLDFYATAKIAPELMLQVGQFITPAQTYETSKLSSSKISLYELADISIKLSNNMGHDSYRDVGIMATGKFDFLEYSAYYGNGDGRFFYTGSNILNRKFGDGLFGLRLDATPTKGFSIGAHYSVNSQDSNYVSDPTTSVKSKKHMDRSSYSINLVTDDFGLPGLFSTIIYAAGEIKDGVSTDYNGITATLGYKILSNFHLIGRYDTYNEEKPNVVDYKTNSTVLGCSYLFFKGKDEIAKLGLNYQIKKEEPVEIDNNLLLLWMQVKF